MSDLFDFQVPHYRVHDNVATTIFSQTIPLTSFARVYVQAAAVRANGDHRTFYRTFSVLRGGGAPLLSSVVDIHAPIGVAGSAAWNLTFALNGNDVQIKVTGQDLATTVWQLKISVFFLKDDD